MQLAASVFHRLTSKTTMSPTAPLVLTWVLCHMEAREGGAGQKDHFVSRLSKYTWKRKEDLLNKIRRENTRANKILELYKIIHNRILLEIEHFFGLCRFLSLKEAGFNAVLSCQSCELPGI